MGLGPGEGGERCLFERRANTRRHAIRTTDLLESLYVKERRWLTIVPNAFGEDAVLKLMSGG